MSDRDARREAATKALFLNRTTFSGILHGRAGPLGGRRQRSSTTLGSRFNPDGLAERLRFVGHLYDTGRLLDVDGGDLGPAGRTEIGHRRRDDLTRTGAAGLGRSGHRASGPGGGGHGGCGRPSVQCSGRRPG